MTMQDNNETAKKKLLDAAMKAYKVQPVGRGYIDCITTKENIPGFVDALTKMGVNIHYCTWWCHCLPKNDNSAGCPHGGGGPASRYFGGYFSEMYHLAGIEIASNNEFLNYFFTQWPEQNDHLPCLLPGLWLDVPESWKNSHGTT